MGFQHWGADSGRKTLRRPQQEFLLLQLRSIPRDPIHLEWTDNRSNSGLQERRLQCRDSNYANPWMRGMRYWADVYRRPAGCRSAGPARFSKRALRSTNDAD